MANVVTSPENSQGVVFWEQSPASSSDFNEFQTIINNRFQTLNDDIRLTYTMNESTLTLTSINIKNRVVTKLNGVSIVLPAKVCQLYIYTREVLINLPTDNVYLYGLRSNPQFTITGADTLGSNNLITQPLGQQVSSRRLTEWTCIALGNDSEDAPALADWTLAGVLSISYGTSIGEGASQTQSQISKPPVFVDYILSGTANFSNTNLNDPSYSWSGLCTVLNLNQDNADYNIYQWDTESSSWKVIGSVLQSDSMIFTAHLLTSSSTTVITSGRKTASAYIYKNGTSITSKILEFSSGDTYKPNPTGAKNNPTYVNTDSNLRPLFTEFKFNTEVWSNTSLGIDACLVDGRSVFVGYNAGKEIGSTLYPQGLVVIGSEALANCTDPGGPLLSKFGESVLGGHSVIIGNQAAYNFKRCGFASSTTWGGNVVIGSQANYLSDSDEYSIAIGFQSMSSWYNSRSIGIGFRAGSHFNPDNPTDNSHSQGNRNYESIFIGNEAFSGYSDSSYSDYTSIIGIGHYCGKSVVGRAGGAGSDVIVGNGALHDSTLVGDIVCIGGNALYTYKPVSDNSKLNTTAVGSNAGSKIQSGIDNTFIGANTGPTEDSSFSYSTAIGSGASMSASHQITLGSSIITSLRCQVTTITSLSDPRVKEDIKLADTSKCLNSVIRLPVSRYKYKDFTGTHLDTHVTGWLSTDYKKVFSKGITYTDESYPLLDENGDYIYESQEDKDNNRYKTFVIKDVESITPTEVLPTLWGAVQELNKIIESQNLRIKELESKVK